ncbi:MAG: phosphate/phosphite/phosphonate ABC transporter substrate-binding protein [Desulfobacteraceae bacterium]|nr:phosphate/phosphite/phosphonate ABC transporter substrate-binding protein [Desulfobacteraceae bacterium]
MNLNRMLAAAIICFLFSARWGNAEQLAPGEKPVRLRMGFDISYISNRELDLKDVKAAMDLWVTQFTSRVKLAGENYFYLNTDSIVRDFNGGKLDLVTTTSISYIRIAQKIDAELGYGQIKNGKKSHKYLVLVHQKFDFKSIEDLKNKRIALKTGDDTGRLFLNTLLLRKNLEEADKFFSVKEKKKFSQAILAVFFGNTHACVTTDVLFKTMAELNPQVGKRLKIMAYSPEIVNTVSFFRRGYEKRAKDLINAAISDLKENVQGQQILMLFNVESVFQLKESDLEPLKSMMSEYETLKMKKKTGRK